MERGATAHSISKEVELAKRRGGGGQLLCDDTQREIQENFNAFFLISLEGRECKAHECVECEYEYEYSLRCTNQLTALIDN